jgi:hypothetical protein
MNLFTWFHVAVGYRLRIVGCELRVAGCELRVATVQKDRLQLERLAHLLYPVFRILSHAYDP